MTIDEAIKVFEDVLTFVCPGDAHEEQDALKLGIGALKCVKEIRHHPFPDTVLHLPGETENV